MRTHFIFVLMLSALMLHSMAQEKSSCTGKAKNNFEVTVKNTDAIHMVYYEFTGPYKDSFNDFGKLMEYMQTNNISMGSNALGVFYDDPEMLPEDELRSEAGYMVTGKVDVSDGYKYKKIDGKKVLSVWYNNMDEIMPAYAALGKYAEENHVQLEGYSIEIYYGMDPENMKTEILMPVKSE
jgi:AraC family transcriptional regulator